MENMLIVALASLVTGIVLGTLLGTEVFKRRITQMLFVDSDRLQGR